MSFDTERFNAIFELVGSDRKATTYFRDFLLRVDGFIQSAAVVSTWGGITGTLAAQTDLQTALNGKVDNGDNVSVLVNDAGYLTAWEPPAFRNEATSPYTLVLGDANTVLRFTANNAAVTVPVEASVNFPVGTVVKIRQAGTGTLVLTTTSLTINGTVPSLAQHVEFSLRKVGADTWDVL